MHRLIDSRHAFLNLDEKRTCVRSIALSIHFWTRRIVGIFRADSAYSNLQILPRDANKNARLRFEQDRVPALNAI